MSDVHNQTLDAEHGVGKHLKWMCDTAPGGRLGGLQQKIVPFPAEEEQGLSAA